jgi:hypothetical protein
MKIRPERVKLFHADRRTDRLEDLTELIVVFRSLKKKDDFPSSDVNHFVSLHHKVRIEMKKGYIPDSFKNTDF